MPSFLAGQRLPAAQLDALTALSAELSGGPTSGTVELLLTGSLDIPAAPVDRLVVPKMQARFNATVANDRFDVHIRETSIAGASRAFGRLKVHSTGIDTFVLEGDQFLLAANTALTLVCTVVQNGGTGVISISSTGGILANRLAAQFFAVP